MITFHIIRSIGAANDDVITIHKPGDLFSVTYSDRDSHFRYSFDASRDQVIEYLYSIFDMLRIDEEPFHSIQITLPAYPAINLKIASLTEKTVTTIMKPIKRSLLKWLASTGRSFYRASQTYPAQTGRIHR
jgi:hypothetical protein